MKRTEESLRIWSASHLGFTDIHSPKKGSIVANHTEQLCWSGERETELEFFCFGSGIEMVCLTLRLNYAEFTIIAIGRLTRTL